MLVPMTLHPLESLTLADYAAPENPSPPPAARTMALGIATALAETLSGRRSPHQFTRWLTPLGCQQVNSWVRTSGHRNAKLIRCQLVMVGDHVEGRLTFEAGVRIVAVALRLDESASEWKCTQLQILLPGNS